MNFPSSVLAACREAHESTTFYTPWKINPTNHPCRKEHYLPNMIFQTSMIMFHVNLQGCIGDVGSISFVYLPRPSRLISIGSIGTQGNLGTLPEEQAEITHYSEGDVFHGWAGWISFLVMVLYPRNFFKQKKTRDLSSDSSVCGVVLLFWSLIWQPVMADRFAYDH